MCIRDRAVTGKGMRQMKREYINDFIELARDTIQGGKVKEMDRYIPVSYTHLDVYKRQAEGS